MYLGLLISNVFVSFVPKIVYYDMYDKLYVMNNFHPSNRANAPYPQCDKNSQAL